VAASEEALRTGGPKQHAHFWAATGLSAELFRREAWRDAGFDSVVDLVTRLFEEDYGSFEPPTCSASSGSGVAPTFHGTPTATSPLRSAGSPPEPSSFRSPTTPGSWQVIARTGSVSSPAASSASPRASGGTTPGE